MYDSKCITEDDDFDLFDYLDESYNQNGKWEVTQGNIVLGGNRGSTFNPSSLLNDDGTYDSSLLSEYIFTYIVSGNCPLEVEVVITMNNDCITLCNFPCELISTALTPNNDGVNDRFMGPLEDSLLGLSCTQHVQIFNRWGDMIFEAQDYQNDWYGSVPSNAIGNSNKIPTGTYYYVIHSKIDGVLIKTCKGYFYVVTE
jgi:gliding motility-associated-like protein